MTATEGVSLIDCRLRDSTRAGRCWSWRGPNMRNG
nr:MAG TPA: hypothetical protein [Caudoviricetes sp.]